MESEDYGIVVSAADVAAMEAKASCKVCFDTGIVTDYEAMLAGETPMANYFCDCAAGKGVKICDCATDEEKYGADDWTTCGVCGCHGMFDDMNDVENFGSVCECCFMEWTAESSADFESGMADYWTHVDGEETK